jgi:hypothetical protein
MMKRSSRSGLVLAGVVAALTVGSIASAQDDETPEQRSYEGRMDAQIRSWIHEQNKAATDEERTFVSDHWKRAERLWRIRKLAEAAKDAATVTRVDADLARADRILENHLLLLRGHAPVMTAAPFGVENVMVAPPPPQVEVQGAAPSPLHKWLPGFWQWNGSRHVWQAGHWAQPPEPGMVWEAPKWENHGGKWAFTDGRWQAGIAAGPAVVYEPPVAPDVLAMPAPPAPIVEVRPAGPPNGVWIPGYWQWNGTRHVWVSGRWSAPKVGMHWQPDHWEHRGNQWALVHGRWAR